MATPREQGRRRCEAPPFGLPVLDEVPELATVLELAAEVDRIHRRLIEQLIELRAARVAETATGVALDRWLATLGRFTRTDRRMLVATADVLSRLPLLRTAYVAGRVSWSQLRAVVCKVRALPATVDPSLDVALADAVDGAADADPDALARAVDWVVAAQVPAPDAEPRTTEGVAHDRLVLQPRLDGSGGTVTGDLGPVGFAALDDATAPGRDDGSRTRDLVGQVADDDAAAANRWPLGRARAARLVDLCLTGSTGRPRPARLYVRAELDSLLGGRLPAQLLTTLAGGKVDVDAATARRLLDELGADARLVITDRGDVVGVGSRTRRPPGWLADVQQALHDTCTEPGCLTAARICDLDHATPVEADGGTDVDNIAPLCASTNRGPDRRRWDVTQTADGVRTWRHRRTGLTTRTIPGTWRPPDRRPPSDDHHDVLDRRRPVVTSCGRVTYTADPRAGPRHAAS